MCKRDYSSVDRKLIRNAVCWKQLGGAETLCTVISQKLTFSFLAAGTAYGGYLGGPILKGLKKIIDVETPGLSLDRV